MVDAFGAECRHHIVHFSTRKDCGKISALGVIGAQSPFTALHEYSTLTAEQMKWGYFFRLRSVPRMKPMTRIRTIAPPYEPPRCFFEVFEYTEQIAAEDCVQKLTQNHLLSLSPSGPIRARSCLMASYPKFIRSLQGIPFLTCWITASESDRKHRSAVTGRILNEHEHVDKQIFEIAQRAKCLKTVANFASKNSPNISYKGNS
jgi:hypothetical protein